MRKHSTILLLSLMLIPLLWNGMSLIHYLVEHTHSFCTNEQDHQHSSTEDCQIICHIAPQHAQGQIPHKLGFYKLKQYISPFSSFDVQSVSFAPISTNSMVNLI